MHRRGLMPDMHQRQLGLDRGVEQRHDMVAGQRKDVRMAGAFEGTHDDIGAAKSGWHWVWVLGVGRRCVMAGTRPAMTL